MRGCWGVAKVGKLGINTPDDAANWTAWFNDLEVALPLGDEAYTPITLERVIPEVS